MMFRRLKAGLVLAIMAMAPSIASAGQIDFFTVGSANPNAGYYAGTIGFGVSDNGVVAATANLSHASEVGAAYTTAGTTNLPVSGRLLSISADGNRAAGYSNDSAGGITWKISDNSLNGLTTVPGSYTQAAAISNNGQYVAGVGGTPLHNASWNFDGSAGTVFDNLGGSSFGWAGAVSDTGLSAAHRVTRLVLR